MSLLWLAENLPPKDVKVLNPRSRKYVMLLGKGGIRLYMELSF